MSSASCYYPNGNPAQGGDIPCSSGNGVQCCPPGWSCKDNGLCFLANQNYLGRYTCTDKSWKSGGCPQICTKGGTAAGDEAILDCGNGYCCDANRPDAGGDSNLGCCHTSTERFQLSNRQAVSASSGGAAAATRVASAAPSASTSSSSASLFIVGPSGISDPAASVSTGSNTQSSLALATTTLTSTSSVNTRNSAPSSSISVRVVTTVVTQSDGSASTSTATHSSFIAAPASTSSSSPSQKSSVSAATIAPAVAVPVAALLLAALLFFLWRRRKQRKTTYNSRDHAAYEPKDPVDMYAAQKPTLPEMESPEMKQSPNGTAPPSYRGVSGVPTEATGPYSRNSELPGSPAFPPGRGPQPTEPSELEGNMYHAYRPPGR